ncbi:hypothetical protein L1987_75408 [Smallanthus sonchifolius]|uniref:Uncharacterized protein n=1 Tax=Smallanthus sonchifolius TaxID=185202 RepID=A0ACB9A6B1_9ASTR|nr:hypothetical protein L1987_75408 [Smallanthus sonchifolius]
MVVKLTAIFSLNWASPSCSVISSHRSWYVTAENPNDPEFEGCAFLKVDITGVRFSQRAVLHVSVIRVNDSVTVRPAVCL